MVSIDELKEKIRKLERELEERRKAEPEKVRKLKEELELYKERLLEAKLYPEMIMDFRTQVRGELQKLSNGILTIESEIKKLKTTGISAGYIPLEPKRKKPWLELVRPYNEETAKELERILKIKGYLVSYNTSKKHHTVWLAEDWDIVEKLRPKILRYLKERMIIDRFGRKVYNGWVITDVSGLYLEIPEKEYENR